MNGQTDNGSQVPTPVAERAPDEAVPDEIHKSLARILLKYAEIEYGDACQTWRDIEHKAQGVITVAGIFIAATVALRTTYSEGPVLLSVLVAFVLGLLVVAVVFALCSLHVTKYYGLQDSRCVIRGARKIATSVAKDGGRKGIRRLVRYVAKDFSAASLSITQANQKKATRVHRAQTALAAAVILSAIAFGMALFAGRDRTSTQNTPSTPPATAPADSSRSAGPQGPPTAP